MIADAVATVTVRLALLEVEPLLTSNVTRYGPVAVKEWTGFCDVLVEPSPKFHCPDVGLPAEVSVNCTACPGAGEAGLLVKDAVSAEAGATLRSWVRVLELVLLLAIRVTE